MTVTDEMIVVTQHAVKSVDDDRRGVAVGVM